MTPHDIAPAAMSSWAELVRTVAATTPPDVCDLARSVAQGALGVSGPPFGRSAAVAFGEQIVVDVSSLTDEVRAAGLAELAGSAVGFVLALWVEDMTVRGAEAFRQILGAVPSPPAAAVIGDNAWAAQEKFLTEVAKLSALDPVTTELVRLRGARAHDCRLCKARRDVTAIAAAGQSEIFDAAEPTGLSGGQEAALKVVDTFVWTPLRWPSGLGAQVATELGPAAAAELVLDIVRNAANKIAVAFAADTPHVESGVEYFAVDPVTGSLRYDVG